VAISSAKITAAMTARLGIASNPAFSKNLA